MNEKISTSTLVEKLRLMGQIGGILTGDRIRTIFQSADRLEELDERVAIMLETDTKPSAITFSEVINDEK